MLICYATVGRHADCLKLQWEALAARRRVLPPDHPDTLNTLWRIAASLVKLNRGGEAIPVIDECFPLAAGKAVDPELILKLLSLRLDHFQKAGDPTGCRTTAEMWEKLNRIDADSLYDAACYRAVAATVQAKTSGVAATRLATEDADRAMVWLNRAVAAGNRHREHMEKDTDLDFLRNRADFQKLVASLPYLAPPPRPVR